MRKHFTTAWNKKLPIIVFNCKRVGNIGRVIAGEALGTKVSTDGKQP